MLAVLQYATSGFWTFAGCAILLGIAVGGVSQVATGLAVIVASMRR